MKYRYDKEQRMKMKKTRKEAIHRIGVPFKSFCVWVAFPTPAEYRRQHAGRANVNITR